MLSFLLPVLFVSFVLFVVHSFFLGGLALTEDRKPKDTKSRGTSQGASWCVTFPLQAGGAAVSEADTDTDFPDGF
jgi:hypothetical protein